MGWLDKFLGKKQPADSKVVSSATGIGSKKDLFRSKYTGIKKSGVKAGSYNKRKRRGYEKMLKEAGKHY